MREDPPVSSSNHNQWRDPDPAEVEELTKLLNDVPREVVTRFEWKSEPGRVFVQRIRELQLNRVSMVKIAEVLDGVSHAQLGSVIAYWQRPSTPSRPRKPSGTQSRRLKSRREES